MVLQLKMDPEAAAARGGFGDERYEKLAFQKQVITGCCDLGLQGFDSLVSWSLKASNWRARGEH